MSLPALPNFPLFPRKQNSDEGLAAAQALLTPLNAVDFVFFLTARHSSNKFALCARSVSSVPFCSPQGPLQNRLRKKIAMQSIFIFYALWLQVYLHHRHKKQKDAALRHLLASFYFAEREGFEPPVQLPVHRISSAARSTTPASFLDSACKYRNYF